MIPALKGQRPSPLSISGRGIKRWLLLCGNRWRCKMMQHLEILVWGLKMLMTGRSGNLCIKAGKKSITHRTIHHKFAAGVKWTLLSLCVCVVDEAFYYWPSSDVRWWIWLTAAHRRCRERNCEEAVFGMGRSGDVLLGKYDTDLIGLSVLTV